MIADRYGVVNAVERDKFEKKFQIAFGYAFMSFNKDRAIEECKKRKHPDFIVEKITTGEIKNKKGLMIPVLNAKKIIYRNYKK